MRRILATYLSVFLAFPANVWGQERIVARTPIEEISAPPVNSEIQGERAVLMSDLHQATAHLGFFAQSLLKENFSRLYPAHFHSLAQPYLHCDAPATSASLQEIDEVLVLVQSKLAAFLERHAADLENPPASSAPENLSTAPQKPFEISPAKACLPLVPLSTTRAPLPAPEASGAAWANYLSDTAHSFQEPLYLFLSQIARGPISKSEVRHWVGWIATLREMRKILSYYATEKEEKPVGPMPVWRFSSKIGASLSKIVGDAAELFNARAAQLGISLASISRCEDRPLEFCFDDAKGDLGQAIQAEQLAPLIAARPSYGRDLRVLRKMAIAALSQQLFAVNLSLGENARTLEPSCRTAPDLGKEVARFDAMSAASHSVVWSQTFVEAVSRYTEKLGQGTKSLPAPGDVAFLEVGQDLARRVFEEVVPDPQRMESALAALTEDPFSQNIKIVLPPLFITRLSVFAALAQEQLGAQEEKLRQAILTAAVRDSLVQSYSDAFLAYLHGLAIREGLNWEAVVEPLWKGKYEAEWTTVLKTQAEAAAFDRAAGDIVSELEAMGLGEGGTSRSEQADYILRKYVEEVAPRALQAARVEKTRRELEFLVEKNRKSIPKDVFVPDVLSPEGYVATKGAIRNIAERHRAEFIERLRKSGFSDLLVKERFGLSDTATLADLVLKQFSEILEATPKREASVAMQSRYSELAWIADQLRLPEAPVQFQIYSRETARRLYDDFLSPIATSTLLPREEKLRALSRILKNVSAQEILLRQPEAEGVLQTLEAATRERDARSVSPEARTLLQRMGTTHSSLQAKGFFDTVESFQANCLNDRKACQELMEQAFSVWDQDEELKALYRKRAVVAFEQSAERFLLDGNEHAAVLADVREEVSRAWLGYHAKEADQVVLLAKLNGWFDDLKSRIQLGSRVSHAVWDLSSSLWPEIDQSFVVWKENLNNRVLQFRKALEAEQTSSAELIEQSRDIFHRETQLFLVADDSKRFDERFSDQLAQVLLPSFSIVREAIQTRLAVVMQPVIEEKPSLDWTKANAQLSRLLEVYLPEKASGASVESSSLWDHFIVDKIFSSRVDARGLTMALSLDGVVSNLKALSFALSADVSQFDLEIELRGQTGSNEKRFVQWVSDLQKQGADELFSQFQQFALENPNEMSLWSLFPTLEAFEQSDLFSQARGLFAALDIDQRGKWIPETYPYFAALLHRHITHARRPSAAASPNPSFPTEAELSSFLPDLTEVMGFDTRSYAGIEKLINKESASHPADWLDIANTTQALWVETGDRRFLSTMVKSEAGGQEPLFLQMAEAQERGEGREAISEEHLSLLLQKAREKDIATHEDEIRWLAQNRDFSKARDASDRARLEKLSILIDGFYEEQRHKEVALRGFNQVASNINTNLAKLCPATWMRDISDQEEFEKAKKLIINSGLIYFDNLIQKVFAEGGWGTDSSDPASTASLLAKMATDLDAARATHQFVEKAVGTAILVSLATLLATRSPMGSRWLAGTGIAQTTARGALSLLGFGVGIGWAGLESYDIYEDYSLRPRELAIVYGVRDTQVTGEPPLMGDDTASFLKDGWNDLYKDRGSYFRWTMHVLGILQGVSSLTQAFRLAKGPWNRLLEARKPWETLQARFGGYATEYLKLSEKAGFNEVKALGYEKVRHGMGKALAEIGNGKALSGGRTTVDKFTAATFADDARNQLKEICRMAELSPKDMLPLRPAAEGSALATFRSTHAERVKGLFDFARRMDRGTPLEPGDLKMLLGNGIDPVSRHTPFWIWVIGVPYWSKKVQALRNYQALVKADLDLMSLFSPATLQLIGHLNYTNLAGRPVETWEVFSQARLKKVTEIPSDLRRVFDDLFREAVANSRVGSLQGMAAEEIQYREMKETKRLFEAAIKGEVSTPSKFAIVHRYHAQLEQTFLRTRSRAELSFYAESYLMERGLSVSQDTFHSIVMLHRLANWEAESHFQIDRLTKEKGVSYEEVIYWMLHPELPQARVFEQGPELVHDYIGEAELVESAGKTLPTLADELRAMASEGALVFDREFAKALSTADYGVLSMRLAEGIVRKRKVEGQPDAWVPPKPPRKERKPILRVVEEKIPLTPEQATRQRAKELASRLASNAEKRALLKMCINSRATLSDAAMANVDGMSIEVMDLQSMADALRIPREWLFSRHTINALANTRGWTGGRSEEQAVEMALRFFGSSFHETAQDARWLLGLEEKFTAEMLENRIASLRNSLEGVTPTNEATRAIWEEAKVRLSTAEKILRNPDAYPAKWVKPQNLIPRFEWARRDLLNDTMFTDSGYPREMLERAAKEEIAEWRQGVLRKMAARSDGLSRVTVEEQLGRRMHAIHIYRGAVETVALKDEASQALWDILLKSYVRNENLIGRWTPDEARFFVRAFARAQGVSCGTWEEMATRAAQEMTLWRKGESAWSYRQVNEVQSMLDVILRDEGVIGAGFERAIFKTHAHLPANVLIEIAINANANPELAPELERVLYYLLDGPAVKWTSRGTHTVGDSFLWAFGKVDRKVVFENNAFFENFLAGTQERSIAETSRDVKIAYSEAHIKFAEVPSEARGSGFPARPSPEELQAIMEQLRANP